MKMKFKAFPILVVSLLFMSVASSCFNNDNLADYSEWKARNEAFIANAETETSGGHLIYEKVSPVWDNNVYVLMKWHNDRSLTENSLTPMSNSTVDIKYLLTTIDGDTIDSSSSFRCQPNGLITGFWTALTNMHESDTVTAIIPYTAAYGAYGSGAVLPYSTLIFGIRLDSIVAFEKRP